jgi:hypothetical protein
MCRIINVNFSYLSHLTIDPRDASQKYISSKVLIEVPRNTPATATKRELKPLDTRTDSRTRLN